MPDRYVSDFIVLGAGAAGSVILNRLSKGGRFSVLGIEAGGNLMSDAAIQAVGLPAFLLPASNPQKYFWPGWKQTVPMAGLNGRVADWTTGMIVGGGSSINGLYYGRGTNAVYSQWQNIANSSNWSLDKILSTFNKLENYQGLTITPGARGTNGPVNVLQTPTVAPLAQNVILPSLLSALPGIPVVNDYNDPSVENGIDMRAQWFIDPTGTKRVSSATAFLGPTVMSPNGKGINGYNLLVLFNSTVIKITFSKRRSRHGGFVARRVWFMQNGQLVKARARKGIIISAGINSSKILQLSGIGPTNVLRSPQVNIKQLIKNNSVGQHLQNHPTLYIALLAKPGDIGVPAGAPYAFTIANVYLPVVGGSASDPRALQILFDYFPTGTLGSPVPVLLLGFDLLVPLSEGSVNIQSNNPFEIAAADDGFYNNPTDLNTVKNMIQTYIRSILTQLALASPPFYQPIVTDPFNQVILAGYSDLAVTNYIKNNTNLGNDIHHMISHCKMAPFKNGGVVDGDTRVYGTDNLFVADNSICPSMPDINTTSVAMMIGWRASSIIKRIFKH